VSRRVLAALLAAAAGTSCVRGQIPQVEFYRIAAMQSGNGEAGAPAALPAPLEGTIAVETYATPGMYGDRSIVYRVEQQGYGAYPYREWAIPLGEMLGMLTQERLVREPVTSGYAVFAPRSRRPFQYVWRGAVREFEEVDRGSDVFAAVSLEVRLIRAGDDSVLWSGTRRAERLVPQRRSMASVVETLSALTTEAIDELIREAKAAVRANPAPAVRSSP
jgi:uncharacterized lipoprotein YmbA